MKSLRRRIDLLELRVIDLNEILSTFLENNNSFDLHKLTVAGITQQWTSYEMAVTLGLMEESVAVYRSIWPKEDDWVIAKLEHARRIGGKCWISIKPEVEDMGTMRIERVKRAFRSAPHVETLFDALCESREILSIASVPYFDSILAVKYGWRIRDDELEHAVADLGAEKKSELQSQVRSYLSNEWLYDWASVTGSHDEEALLGVKYRRLFFAAAIVKEDLFMSLLGGLESVLQNVNISQELREVMQKALKRLATSLLEDGVEGLFDVLGNDGSIFGAPSIGAESMINIIPGNNEGFCKPCLFAFAKSGSKNARFGAIQTMRRVREHLIECNGQIQVVFFFAPIDDLGKVIEESVGDMKAHMDTPGSSLQEFIPVAIFNRRMSVMSWR